MKYIVETNYLAGMPQTILQGGLMPLGIAIHWTAGGAGRKGALATANGLVGSAATRNASYHILTWFEAPDTFGVMWIVRPDRAAHSMNPNPPSRGGSYEPNAEVRRILGPRVGDPNAACLAVSFAGMPADLEAALKFPAFVDGYVRLINELSAIDSIVDRPLFNHGWAQPSTRYDAGEKLIPTIYGEDDMDWINDIVYMPPERVVVSAQASYRRRPDLSAESSPVVLGRESTRDIFGSVQGEDFGAGPLWYVMVSGSGGLKVFHSQDIVSRVVLSPTSITPAQLEAQKAQARAAGIAAAASNAANTK